MYIPTIYLRAVPRLALAALLMHLLGGCDNLTNRTDLEHVQRAKDFQTRGDLKEAIIELKNAVNKNGNNAEARWLLGEAYLQVDQGAGAEKELKRAQELGIAGESLRPALGKAYLLQGKYQQAVNEIQPGEQASAGNRAILLKLRGDAYRGLRQEKEACQLYSQANQTDASYPGAYLGLAYCAAQGDKTGALKLVEKALEKSPGDIEALLQKGDMLHDSGQSEQAKAVYGEVLKLRKDHAGAYLRLATVFMGENKLAEARAQIDKARKAQPGNLMTLYMAALVDYRDNKFPQARDNLLQVLKSADHAPSVILFGAVSYSLGAYEQAEQKLSPMLERYPQNAYLRKLLTATQLKQGKSQGALATIGPLLTPQADAQTLSLAGEAYMGARDLKKAAEYFEKAATVSSAKAPAYTRLGITRLAGGEVEEGIAELEKASALDPTLTQADGALITVYMKTRQYDKALAVIDGLEKKQPNSPLVHNMRGGALLGKGDPAGARKNFERALAIDPAFVPAAKNLSQMDLLEKKPAEARKRFENVLAKDKNNLDALLALADLAQSENRPDEYIKLVDRAVAVAPKAFEPKAREIGYYLSKNQGQKALYVAREAQALHGDNAQAWELLGRTQLAVGEKENALASFVKVTQLAPDEARAHLDLGVALGVMKRWKEAREAFTKALSLNPQYLDARRALISLELNQKRGAEALKVAEEASRLRPDSSAGPTLEGDVLMAQKQFVSAAKAYERAFGLAKNGQPLAKYHQAMVFANQAREADAKLLAWLNQNQNDIATRIYFADSLSARKEFPSAIAQLEAALKTSPGNASVLNNLAVVYSEVGDARALATAEQAYKTQSSNPYFQDTLGWVLLKQGQTARALSLLKEASAAAPEAYEIHYHYAEALARSGDKGKAKEVLKGLLGNPQARFPGRDAAKLLLSRL